MHAKITSDVRTFISREVREHFRMEGRDGWDELFLLPLLPSAESAIGSYP